MWQKLHSRFPCFSTLAKIEFPLDTQQSVLHAVANDPWVLSHFHAARLTHSGEVPFRRLGGSAWPSSP